MGSERDTHWNCRLHPQHLWWSEGRALIHGHGHSYNLTGHISSSFRTTERCRYFKGQIQAHLEIKEIWQELENLKDGKKKQ